MLYFKCSCSDAALMHWWPFSETFHTCMFFCHVLKCSTMPLLNSFCGFVRVILFAFYCVRCVKMGKRYMWVIGNYDLKWELSPIVSTAQKSWWMEKHFLYDLYPSKLIIYAFLVFISESMQTLFLFNMHRKGKWKMPKVDLKWIWSFLLPQYNLVCQKIMVTLG